MKKLLIIGLAVFTMSFSMVLNHPGISKQNNELTVRFTSQLTFNDLVNIKLDLGDQGITLKYNLIEYSEHGELIKLSFNVDCNDGFNGMATSLNITNNSNFGFYRDFNQDSKQPFGVGALP